MALKDRLEDIYPLSPTQQGMLFHSLYEPDRENPYFLSLCFGLPSDLDPEALRQAWQLIVDRHPALRTAFLWEGRKEPIQLVMRRAEVPWRELDWSGLELGDVSERLEELLVAERGEDFDLRRAPLMRFTLITLADGSYRLVWCHHHILIDGWSGALILPEVLTGYQELVQGRVPSFPKSRPFGDYISWLRGQDRERAAEYWRSLLTGFHAATPLGVDHPPPALDDGPGEASGEVFYELPPTLGDELDGVSRRLRLTRNALLLAAWAQLLARYSGQRDVVFGVTVHGRPAELVGVQKMVGMFINTLPMRLQVDPDRPLAPWLAEIQKQHLELAELAHCSLVEIQGWSEVPRGGALFDSILVLESSFGATGDHRIFEGLEVLDNHSRTNYPLTLATEPREGLRFSASFDRRRFSETTTVRRLLGHLGNLLAGYLADPERRLGEMEILTAAERQQLLVESSAWFHSVAEECLHDRIRHQALRQPDAVAVVFEDQRLSFGVLDRRAEALAWRLRARGARPEVRIGICLERGLDLAVSVLAVMKSGAAYVPLEAGQGQRLEAMIEDAGVAFVLTQESLRGVLPETIDLLLLDGPEAATEVPGQGESLPRVDPCHLAYVIFTSGSTGRPKAVPIEHGGLMSTFRSWQAQFPLGSEIDSFLQMASFSFDVFTGDFIRALGSGGRLVICSREAVLDPETLYGVLSRERVAAGDFVPAVVRGLCEHLAEIGGILDPLRLIVVGSDAWYGHDLAALRPLCHPRARIVNAYGLSEATIDSTWGVVFDTGLDADRAVSIGRPCPHVEGLVLDRDLQPVPFGVAGELCVGGSSLTRGYLGRGGLTAERFIPLPTIFGLEGDGGERLYRSGDRVRWRADGRLEFLGRLDHQVKVRGFRIEPGEIESVLGEHPAVRRAAVVSREGASGGPMLLGFVVPADGSDLDLVAIRAFLSSRLPDYMVPGRLGTVESLPLSPNGKIDRVALRKLEALDTEEMSVGGRATLSPGQQLLVGIWTEVLDLEHVDIDSSFFELGGHSLLATRVTSRIRQVLGVELPVAAIFEAPTIRELAVRVETARGEGVRAEGPPLLPGERPEHIPLSFAQERLWFLDRLTPGLVAYNMPSALRLRGEVSVSALERSLSEIVARHEVLRTTFKRHGDQPHQVISPTTEFRLPITDLRSLAAAERRAEARKLAAAEAIEPFDLERGPLLRGALLRLGEQHWIFLLTAHHSILDGWSIGLLVEEMTVFYRAFVAGETATLAPLPVQYADFAIWQREALDADLLSSELDFWRGRLEGAPELLELPTDRPRPSEQTFRGAGRRIRMAPALLADLQGFSRRFDTTLFMVLLAGFKAFLARITGQRDLVVAVPVAGRQRVEVERLLGFFINTLALRTEIRDEPGFGVLSQRVRNVSLDGFSHQDLPFEKLVEELNPERSKGYNPVVQVLFVLQNTPLEELRLPGLRLEPFEIETSGAQFDLSISLEEIDGGIGGGLLYNLDLFDATTAHRWAESYSRLLRSGIENPDTPIWQLDLLSPGERHQLLVEWNDTARGYDLELIHGLFEAQVREQPDAVAVVFGDSSLSYGELDSRANRLAHYLRRCGTGVEDPVMVCLERSFDLIISFLAVLKAGGSYIPLDPKYPRERLALMHEGVLELQDSEDSRELLLLSRTEMEPKLPEGPARRLFLDQITEEVGKESPLPTESGVLPENLAYVLFTSGSTGRPKGAQILHRGFASVNQSQREDLRFGPSSRVLQLASMSFDLSIYEITAALGTGATLILDIGEDLLGARFLDFLRNQRVSGAMFPPSSLAALPDADLPDLETVSVGGEACTAEVLRRWAPGRNFVNLYGPTEVSILATNLVCDSNSEETPSIGRPLDDYQLYVVDRHLREVAMGCVGELLIGGIGMGRGYVGRPGHTARSFIPNPFSGKAGDRLYRTGDLVRYRADGEPEFLGRIDQQVKLRGLRIELGEIEAAVLDQPSVRETVVMAPEIGGERRLVAYVVAEPGESYDDSSLRQALARRLPDYMVPGILIQLDALPLNNNGKIDRRALPDPTEVLQTSGEAVAPRTPRESELVEIFEEVLGVHPVGVTDDFFELGGHSLLATRVMARIEQRCGVDLPLGILFESPTVEALATEVEQASGEGHGSPPPLVPVSRDEALPLSFGQERLWFLDRLQPGNTAYNIPLGMRLEGELSIGALAGGLRALVQRHETLRTSFPTVEGEPVQHIAAIADLPLPVIDLNALPSPRLEAEQQAITRREAEWSFDLANGPLVRTVLVRRAENDHALLLNLHHIISDGASTAVLARDLGELYEAALERRASRLDPLPVQYGDFSVWQRQWLSDEVLEGELAYWRERLEAADGKLELPTDRPRPAQPTHRGKGAARRVSSELADSLDELARRAGVSRFMLFLAAFQTLLMRLTGQTDVAVGTPAANRDRVEVEGLNGFFVNTLVMRSDLGGDPSFSTFLRQVREVCLGGYAHRDLPFEKLVAELQPDRDLSRSPIFQVMFLLQEEESPMALEGLTLSPLATDSETAQFDLLVGMGQIADDLWISATYSLDLFDATTIERQLGQMEVLLGSVVRDPEARLSELEVMTPAQRHQLLLEWNDSARGDDLELIHGLFEAQARQRPEAEAVVLEGESLTYGELDARANRLAHHLRRFGVGIEVPVTVCVERSFDLIVSFLAVLKAGGIYVPLDPKYPRERLTTMVEGARALVGSEASSEVLLLTRTGMEPRLPEGPARRLFLDQITVELEAESSRRPESGVEPENLAYVLFTSGSTGRPKGVQVSHSGFAAVNRSQRETFQVGPSSRVMQFSSMSFDLSIFEMTAALGTGGTLVLDTGKNLMGTDLLDFLRDQEISYAILPPSSLAALPWAELPDLVSLTVGGEACTAEVMRRWAPGRHFVNLYGPTEATILATTQVCDGSSEASPTIGRPLDDYQLYVVDRKLRQVPLGCAGELLIGGVGLGRGYLARPELTAGSFVPNPFGGLPGDRLYRSGDLARFRADGEIEFLGRIDHQVKLRGFRIELGEIEAGLLAQPAIREAVVTAPAIAGDRRLVAYVVPESGEAFDEATVRRALSDRLPEYMVPGIYLELEALPLNNNGKIDRKALPEPAAERGETAIYVAPRNPLEQELVEIFEEVLGLQPVGVTDHFFALGGHSLLATRVIARIQKRFGVDLPLSLLFESPTAEDLALGLEGSIGGPAAMLPELVPVPRDRPLPLSFGQERLWFLDRFEPGSAAYNIPFGLRLEGPLSVSALAGALLALARRHETLRTTFPEVEGDPLQHIAAEAEISLPVIDLGALPPARGQRELERIARDDGERPFDLIRGPLVRAHLVRASEEEHALLVNLHHIISDGGSAAVLSRDLGVFYQSALRGGSPELPPLPVQYADFAVWQRGWLEGEALDRQLEYWRQKLAGAGAALELPVDRRRPARSSYRGGDVARRLDRGLEEKLDALGRRAGVSRFMLSLAAVQALLLRLTGETDLTVGSPVANRDRMEIEGLNGFFVNTLVLRTDLAGDPSFSELLAQVRTVCLEAYAHRDLPFEKLVAELQPERDLSRSPFFQVMLLMQEGDASGLDLEGLHLSPLPVASDAVKFDLIFGVSQTEDGLWVTTSYRRELFDRSTVERQLAHFENLLEQVATRPELPLSRASLLSPSERHQMLLEWNDTTSDADLEVGLAALVAAQVRRAPDSVAVVAESSSTTYGCLWARALGLANELRSLGVGPEVRVGVAAERSVDLVVGVLGVVIAGGAYVPLDPEAPQGRLEYMLEDSRPAALVTQSHLADPFQALGIPVVLVEKVVAAAPDRPLEDVPASGGDHLAYVIYTSGSTGRPKGAMNTHRGLVNRLRDLEASHSLGPGDGVLQKTPFGFDVAAWEIFWPLVSGARLHMARPGGHRDSSYLARSIRDRRITATHFVPSMLELYLESDEIVESQALRQVFAGGEALSHDLQRRFEARHPEVQLFNFYGPAEAAVDVTSHLCESTRGLASLPIGRPIPNLGIHLLDPHLEPVPVGVAGELCITGVGVGRGYLFRPGLTAERFVPSPFAAVPGERMYRSGDLARRLADGTVEFLGRMDHQVKIRGQRIELGEIEAVLSEHPSVRRGVVVVNAESTVGPELVAFVVPADDTFDESSVGSFLRTSLTEAMIPARWMTLDTLPLNPSGKVDRLALSHTAAEVSPREESPMAHSAPRDHLEWQLVSIFEEVLDVRPVGIDDGFFELGGHSLLANRVIARIKRICGVDLPLSALFEAPSVGELARVVSSASSGEATGTLPEILPLSRNEPLPLSFGQERLWFLDRLQPDSAAYNIPLGLRLRGDLSLAALSGALNALVRRQETLRTTFPEVEGRPQQRIADTADLPLSVVDLSGLPHELAEGRLLELIENDANRPFDLESGPLIRALLVRRGSGDHGLLVTVHHIVSDGGSTAVLARDLGELYEAAIAGRGATLPALAVQYADFAGWQRQWLRGETLERQLAYWREQLLGAEGKPELPTDRPRPNHPNHRGGQVSRALGNEVSAAVDRLTREAGASRFMVLLAAVQTLLFRLTGETDVAVGSPVDQRDRVEIENLNGFFVNTLVLRSDLGGEPTFLELLQQVREVCLGAYAHRDVPFEKLVAELQPDRDLSRSPFFQVMFLLQEDRVEPALGALQLEPLPTGAEEAKFDLMLGINHSDQGLWATAGYSRELFEATTVERQLQALRLLLEAIARQPATPLSALELLSPSERHQLLVEWNDSTTAAVPERIQDLFEAQVRARPGAGAVSFGTERLTYAELDARANRLARHLQRLGVGPEAPVAICVDRSIELVLGFLAILKAGGVYVPLDPKLPKERMGAMLEGARELLATSVSPVASGDGSDLLLLTRRSLLDRLPEAAGTHHLFLEETGQALEAESDAPPKAEISPDHLAYLLFTSGSTGRPKGVLVTHRGFASVHRSQVDVFRVRPESRVLQFSSMSFDLSVFEMVAALSTGAELVLGSADDLLGTRLLEFLAEQEIGYAVFPPSFLASLPEAELPHLRSLTVGGEACSAEVVKRWAPGRHFVNLYGPTEATILATTLVCDPVAGTPTIGRPIADYQLYVFDHSIRPTAMFTPGELLIGGIGLGRGYLGRPGLTARSFVPNPFAKTPGERLYRTGDLARYRADGEIEFLGRIDHQVKLRGFRIELGEIEASLLDQPTVREAAVMAPEIQGDRRLVAYLVTDEEPIDESVLREALARRLPEYMVPDLFVALDALPLNHNGKIDRRALPIPSFAESDRIRVEPRDPVEWQLTEIFQEVLGVEAIGVHDGFFELGGHSLLSIRLMAEIERRLGQRLPVAVLFSNSSVEELASVLRRNDDLQQSSLVPIRPRGDRPPLFLVHPVGGHVLCYRSLLPHLDQDLPVYGLQARGLEDGRKPLETIPEMATFYLEEIRRVEPAGPYFLAGWSFGGAVAFELARRLTEAGEAVAFVGLIDTHASLGATWPRQPEEKEILAAFVYDFFAGAGERPPFAEDELLTLPVDEVLARSAAAGNRLLRAEDEMAQLQGLLAVFRANLLAQWRYQPAALSVGLDLFRAEQTQSGRPLADEALGWRIPGRELVRIVTVPGDHHSMMDEPNVRTLGSELSRALVDAVPERVLMLEEGENA